ncbi:MAG: 30S ribosomal protein S9 [Bacteroidetes bacterium]|nr:30S ribosomal protein S9 [Bacteroidota bacterium]MBU1422968.1 30S ribosomal protein S9 [Bacteroidota bacterium]MBU2470849.1 30S ribosomal protein S9 [Bacteroidota bacterium]MBU2636172.1 30S ribosomal protein S9 [Bacteroidota bacterium]
MHNIITVGRRKNAVARVVLKSGTGDIFINKKSLQDYFKVDTLCHDVLTPFEVTANAGKYNVYVTVEGGGMSGQAGAVRLGISRALIEMNDENRGPLRNAGLLTRDPRMVERKKYGQKKARKRFQFSKR